eukprot:14679881-Ditylum_brightwellii.AAC.1
MYQRTRGEKRIDWDLQKAQGIARTWILNSTNHPVEESLDESLSSPENIDSGETDTCDVHSDDESNGSDELGSGELETGEPKTGEDLVQENNNPTDADPDLDKTLLPDICSDPNEG